MNIVTILLAAKPLLENIADTALFSFLGILMAALGFMIVEWITPGKIADQIAHDRNVAMAIVVGSLMLGICIIIAATIAS